MTGLILARDPACGLGRAWAVRNNAFQVCVVLIPTTFLCDLLYCGVSLGADRPKNSELPHQTDSRWRVPRKVLIGPRCSSEPLRKEDLIESTAPFAE
jgi:hypothetical protein